MAQVSKEAVLKALSSILWEGQDIVSKGMVLEVTFTKEPTGTKVHLIFKIEPKKEANFDALKRDSEEAVKKVEGVSSVDVIFTANKEAQPKHGRAHSGAAGPEKIELPNIAHIIVVASGKGGVGKSTTAVNLAAAFSQKGLKTGLLDADVYGPSIPRMMGLRDEPEENAEGQMEPLERDGIKVMSIGFMIREDQPMIWRGPMVHAALMQFLRQVAWGALDVLVVDLPPGTGDAQLTFAQSIPVAGAVIVSTPQDIALIDARKALAMFSKTDVPILGIIENMSYFECPHCGGRSEIFSHAGAKSEADKLNIPFLGEIPLDIVLRRRGDEGQPLTLSEPDNPITKAFQSIAARLWKHLNA
ncbi:MAG: Mrp/NBP35 family ATP-binding protein [Alphaproteobacteria bacterium]|nr:Mrp/NBP35 family ATP-binding protein [Alphaproteobacteria bacterium]